MPADVIFEIEESALRDLPDSCRVVLFGDSKLSPGKKEVSLTQAFVQQIFQKNVLPPAFKQAFDQAAGELFETPQLATVVWEPRDAVRQPEDNTHHHLFSYSVKKPVNGFPGIRVIVGTFN